MSLSYKNWINSNNLALIQISGFSDFNVPELDFSDSHQSGEELIIVGKFVNLSKLVIISQKTFINYILGKSIFVDAQPKAVLNGGALINNGGRIIGMTFIRNGKLYSTDSKTIDGFLKNYLNKNQTK